MIKKLLISTLACILLSGCNSKEKPITLSFATWGSASEMTIVNNVVKDFETENPNIKIKIQHIPQNYFKKLHLLFASNSAPDILLINNQNLPTYANFLMPLNHNKLKQFFPNAITALSYNNELKAIPRDISTLVIYYNKNLVSPRENWSLQDFLTDGQRLKEKGYYLIALERDIFYLYPFLLSNNENLSDISEDTLETSESVKLYRNLSELYHYAPLQHELGMATPAEFFLNEKAAYYLSGRWMTPKITEQANFDWGIKQFPRGTIGSVVPCDATGWAITKNTKHPQEAQIFLEFLSSKETLSKMGATGLIIPARIDATSANIPNIFIKLAYSSKPITYPQKYDKFKDKVNEKLKSLK